MPDITAKPNAAGPLFSQPVPELTRIDEPKDGTLAARVVAILRHHGTLTIFQVADIMKVPDHCISQRFSELVDKGLIRRTGEQRKRPISNKMCDVYAATDPIPPEAPQQLRQDRSPSFLLIDNQRFVRNASRDDVSIGGLAYTGAPPSQAIVYVAFVTCPQCGSGRLLYRIDGDKKSAPCTNPHCKRNYRVMTLTDPTSGQQHLSLVLKSL